MKLVHPGHKYWQAKFNCIQLHSTYTPQDVAFSDPKNERALGQLLVLLQYKWPKEEEMFASVITTIQKRRKFNFPEFFNYVISICLQ